MGFINDLLNKCGQRSDREWHRENAIERRETTRDIAEEAERDYQRRLRDEREKPTRSR